jgi:hypothetical protein
MSRGRVETLNQIHEGRMVSPVDEEADFGKESRFPPHAVRLQLARIVIEEVTGKVVSIQSSVEHGEWVARRFPLEHRVKTVDHTVRAAKDEPALGMICSRFADFDPPFEATSASNLPTVSPLLLRCSSLPSIERPSSSSKGLY